MPCACVKLLFTKQDAKRSRKGGSIRVVLKAFNGKEEHEEEEEEEETEDKSSSILSLIMSSVILTVKEAIDRPGFSWLSQLFDGSLMAVQYFLQYCKHFP